MIVLNLTWLTMKFGYGGFLAVDAERVQMWPLQLSFVIAAAAGKGNPAAVERAHARSFAHNKTEIT